MSVRILEITGLRKEYPGVVALDDVCLSFAGGKVHALLGKNGAGKSTLVKILSGSTMPSAGRLLIDGQEIRFSSPADAVRQGVATVHQELSLVPDLTVAENILLGRMPTTLTFGVRRIDWPAAFERARWLLNAMDAAIDVRRKARELGVAQQQIVEIAKALSFEPTVLLLDEPTSALAQHETAQLFRAVRLLATRGVVILYITHRLQELAEIADTVTVLRDGKIVGSVPFDQTTPRDIVQMMFGPIEQRRRPANLAPGTQPLMEVRYLTRIGRFQDVSFTLHRGEILGIAGTLGSGRTELLRALFGADAASGGDILIEGQPFIPKDPTAARRAGIALVPESRKEEGLVISHSTRSNLFLASLEEMAPHGVCSGRRERRVANELVQRLAVKLPNLEAPVATLSGGNQQKVVVGKWLNARPRIFLFDEPTRGIDLGAKQELFQVIWDLSRQGIGCIVVSSELQELVEICHRILLLKGGRLVDEFRAEDVSADELWLRCMAPQHAPISMTP